MIFSNYRIDLEKAIKLINKNNFKLVALQMPEGLKNLSNEIHSILRKRTKSNIILIADPCYGSCDIPYNDLIDLNIDLLIHIGHTDINCIDKKSLPIIYLNAFSIFDISKIIKKSIKSLEGANIGIVTTVQYFNHIDRIREILEENNYKTFISKGDKRINHKGQILGCNYSSALKINNNVDSFLFVGSGYFHPIGLSLSTKKPIIVADPFNNQVLKEELNSIKNKILKQRYGAISLSKKALNYGILIGLKPGQRRLELAFNIKNQLDLINKNNIFLAMNNFSPIHINYLKFIDCYISTSCPRIAIDDYIQYKKPIITPLELEIVIGKRKWEDYEFDQL